MRKINYGLMSMLTLLMCAITSCGDAERPSYEGPNYILFSDTLTVLAVQNNEEVFDIPVAATEACSYDRTVAVEVIDKKSNAIEGKHYTIESNTITIKAGERAANVRIRGNYDAIAATDSLGLTLRLLTQQADQWDLYEKSYEAKVILQKCCPFDINLFNGYAVLTSTYMQEFMPNVDNRLIKAIIDPEEENTIIMKDFFYDGYNVKIRFTTNDILNPLIEMDEQTFASTAEAFGTNYGDGYLHLYQSSSGVSYYSTCEQFIFQYFTLYVPGMAGNNVVGTFASAIEWISNDEAKRLYLEGSMLVSETVKTDFETYWSCCRIGTPQWVGKKVVRNNMYKQCNFSMFWTTEALLECYHTTGSSEYLKLGQRVLDEMLMTQASWQPPYIYVNGVGGFGVMNADGEWNDSRGSLFSEIILQYGKLLNVSEYMERGVCALKTSFEMMYCPQNLDAKRQWEKVWPFFDERDYGFTMENYGHGGSSSPEGDGMGEFTIYDWGNGAASEAYNRILDKFGKQIFE